MSSWLLVRRLPNPIPPPPTPTLNPHPTTKPPRPTPPPHHHPPPYPHTHPHPHPNHTPPSSPPTPTSTPTPCTHCCDNKSIEYKAFNLKLSIIWTKNIETTPGRPEITCSYISFCWTYPSCARHLRTCYINMQQYTLNHILSEPGQCCQSINWKNVHNWRHACCAVIQNFSVSVINGCILFVLQSRDIIATM